MNARLWLAAMAVLLTAGPAAAASFSCAKAATPVEKTICADPALSALDEEVAEAFDDAESELGLDRRTSVGSPLWRTYRQAQRAWLAERDRCAVDRACLRRQYRRRLDVLSFKPDPADPGPVDAFVGRFKGDGENVAYGAIFALSGRKVLVTLNNGRPGQWYCTYQGLAESDGRGGVKVRPPYEIDDRASITLRMTPDGLEVVENPQAQKAFHDYCAPPGYLERWMRKVR